MILLIETWIFRASDNKLFQLSLGIRPDIAFPKGKMCLNPNIPLALEFLVL